MNKIELIQLLNIVFYIYYNTLKRQYLEAIMV